MPLDLNGARIPQRIRAYKDLGILGDVFTFGMKLNTSPTTYLFQHIYAPIREPTATGMPVDANGNPVYTYIDIGLTTAEVADYYFTLFSGNYFPEYYSDAATFRAKAALNQVEIVQNIKAIIKKNEYKYKRLIEIQGYSWNPLWNVDGVTLHSHIEQHGGTVTTTEADSTFTHSVAPYDSTATRTEYEDRAQSDPTKNAVSVTHTAELHSVASTDNAFGEALTAGDYYSAEKEVRQGNIGVTKTTELLRDARKEVLWSVVDEFFSDINQSILIPIY